MKVCRKVIAFALIMSFIVFSAIMVLPVKAYEILIWDAYVLSSGAEVTSPILLAGKTYRIVADEIWWYDYDKNLAADAQYYTTDGSDSWDWGNYFPAPGGHSFLQINNHDVNWGPFSNGDTGHTYTIYYVGEGAALTFKIVDWIDGNYTNNGCKIRVRIYKPVIVGGYVVDSELYEASNLPAINAMIATVLIIVPLMNHCKKIVHKTRRFS